MATFRVDVSKVITGREAPTETNPKTAGLWYNHVMYLSYLRVQQLGGGDELQAWTNAMIDIAEQTLEPSGVDVIKKVSDILLSALPDSSFDALIKSLSNLFDNVSNNPDLRDTDACTAASVANYSAMFWSEVVVDGKPAMRISRHTLLIICADVTGALGGMGGGGIFGPVGGIIGGILGGAAGSLSVP